MTDDIKATPRPMDEAAAKMYPSLSDDKAIRKDGEKWRYPEMERIQAKQKEQAEAHEIITGALDPDRVDAYQQHKLDEKLARARRAAMYPSLYSKDNPVNLDED